ncbi:MULTISPECIES: YitT family protein [unclassified Neptuniibacter]|uniref:YitT family protein n=1 Tax=unclassified Neptuniibacter TaxID=2630693 RepID=UPI0025EDEF9D|nr:MULTISPECIES: YitT family protein [unclassified Neptuniibacter]|tara:strand:- start:18230 stop:19075 length:846 start_codon:yes stop_codon:yes gene_type:complete
MKKFRFLFDYILMMVGCASLSCGIFMFLAPSQIAAGGPPGLAILGHYSLGISTGFLLFIINFPLVLAGYKLLGRKLFIRSLVVVVLTAFFTHFLPILFELPDLGDNRLLNALYGGLMMGLGIGLMFKAGSSSGGWSILARLISSRLNLSLGQCLFFMDAGVILLSALVFQDFEAAMLGGIAVFVTGRMVDLIVSGSSDIKVVHISCWKAGRLKPIIEKQLGISGSVIQAKSLKSGGDKEILFLIIEKTQLVPIRKVVEDYDPEAYLVVMNAMEVYGTGSRA